jgi:hypothetical protein
LVNKTQRFPSYALKTQCVECENIKTCYQSLSINPEMDLAGLRDVERERGEHTTAYALA